MAPVETTTGSLIKDLARLRFCNQELLRRVQAKSEDEWYWHGKTKIGRFLIKKVEAELHADAATYVPPLSGAEVAETLNTHPLLQRGIGVRFPSFQTQTNEWAQQIRHKVANYIRTISPLSKQSVDEVGAVSGQPSRH